MKDTLKINEAFWSLQSEGANTGSLALFVRMPYCNLKCDWCDTDVNRFSEMSEKDLLCLAKEHRGTLAVITGGEPMFNRQTPRVIEILKGQGFTVACETNGTMPILEGIDWPTVSPKRSAAEKHQPRPPLGSGMGNYDPWHIHPHAFEKAKEFKYVVDRYFDFSVLDRHDITDGRYYYLSPEFSEMAVNVNKITDYMKRNPKWKISVQYHKWLQIQ